MTGSRARRGGWMLASVVLAVATLGAHGWSLRDGLALDDHWHYHSVRQAGWSLSDLINATTIDVREQVHLWWQEKDVRFAYARPVAVALLKATYAVSGDSPVAAHAVSLALHFAAALLVYGLCLRLTDRRRWALAGGLAFTMYPHTVYAAGWLAAQNIVLQTGLMLAGLLCYVRASGLDLSPEAAVQGETEVPRLSIGFFMITILLWLLALGSRENAIMLPGILVAFDLAYGGWRQIRKRLPVYSVFAVIGVAFLAWRLVAHYEPMPEVYVRRSGDAGYLLWCVAKLFHYVCAALWPVPMIIGPSGRYQPFTEVPGDMAAMIVLVVVALGAYVFAARRMRGFWIWPLWILLAVAPVIPVLATPHSGYLCGVGVAVGIALACAGLARRQPRPWKRTAYFVAIFIVLSYMVSMKVGRLLWKGMAYAEEFTTMGMAAAPPPVDCEHVFCINLPFSGIYAKRCLVENAGPRIDTMAFDVLTFAPDLVRMDALSSLVQIDDRAFSVEVADARYFSGLLGRFLIAGFRDPCPFTPGERFDADGYSATIVDADADGVRKLEFRFAHPLNDPRYCFYLSSWECGAVRLTFSSPQTGQALPDPPATAGEVHDAASRVLAGDASAGAEVFAALRSNDAAVRATADEVIELHVALIANALAAPIQQELADSATLGDHADGLWNWWRANVDDDELAQIFHDRQRVRRVRHRRDEIQRSRDRSGAVAHTDLFLNGKPYPGLRPGRDDCDR